MNKELARCPCGQIPTDLIITNAGQGGKWGNVSGNCCGTWEIEFRTSYFLFDSVKCKHLAIEAWNDAPRATTTEGRNR
jgi:hypothetical protein